jgi:hypothetical protein
MRQDGETGNIVASELGQDVFAVRFPFKESMVYHEKVESVMRSAAEHDKQCEGCTGSAKFIMGAQLCGAAIRGGGYTCFIRCSPDTHVCAVCRLHG